LRNTARRRRNSVADTIWQMKVPVSGSEYAKLLVIEEEMEKLPARVLCEACGASLPPDRLIVEWDDGSDVIGDFTFAIGELVCTERVFKKLRRELRGLKSRPLEMHDHPSLYRPKRRTRRTRVWLPYDGPPLCALEFPHEVELLPESTVVVESTCNVCGRMIYADFVGVETRRGFQRIPRKAGKGFFVSAATVGDSDFFTIRNTRLKLCTTRVREFVEEQGYTNLEFLEAGNIVT